MSCASKVLAKLAASDPRVEEYEHDPGNDAGEHWLHLRWPWTTPEGGSIHEYTVKDCLSELSSAYKEKGATA